MDSNYVVRSMNEYLHVASEQLANWLTPILSRVTDNWWDECVLPSLSYNQREFAKNKGFTQLGDFDLAALLRIADQSWYEMRSVAYLPTRERECIRSMRGVRNNWAHCGSSLPGKDLIVRDIDILIALLEQLGAPKEQVEEVVDFKKNVEAPSFVAEAKDKSADLIKCDTPEATRCVQTEIQEKTLVHLASDPSIQGVVLSVDRTTGVTSYQVFIEGALKTLYEGQISAVDNTPKYNWVDVSTFQSYLTAHQINNPSSSNLYSLNAAKIDFVPYQFRPALKLIKADEPRILIADSVGVGKTIEAGLIIKELEARNDLDNVMIICPKPLVSERKWELEMKRFDEDFVPLDGATLRHLIEDTDRDGEWPSRYNKVIVPYSILDRRVYEGDGKKAREYTLEKLDPAPHFDLVIVDEAHAIRNGSMEKERAFAYKCVKYFCDHADAVVMLTATPIQTSDENLYTLLNVLRPDLVIDKMTFDMMAKPNPFISRCSRIVRNAKDGWQIEAAKELRALLSTQWGENVIAQNPLYNSALARLEAEEISREERVRLITDIESLHSFNTMLNRTRRKDIQDFCVRRSHTIESEFTAEQRELHDELLSFERLALATIHAENVRSIPFMMSTIRRQASSCIFGLAPFMREIVERRFCQIVDDPNCEYDFEDFDEESTNLIGQLGNRVITLAENLPSDDPKFDSMLEIISHKQQMENNKIIIFSTFRHTLAYLKKRLNNTGVRVGQIDGSVKDEDRWELRKRFELPKEDEYAIDILLFTEVGSEGLDYQFCDLMINYDLPWNPMRIEQRIGRIDRRGQKSEAVNIYNMITTGTVDAYVYERCHSRIGVFEQSIGDCEEILGEIGKQIELVALDTTLTDDEVKAKLEQIADNEIRKVQELSRLEDEEKELFGFDLSNYTTAKEIKNAENQWLSPQSIQVLVEKYLSERLGKTKFSFGESDVKLLRLAASDRKILLEDFRKLAAVKSGARRKWEAYLKGDKPNQQITFASDAAEKHESALFVTATHPLVRQAAAYYETTTVSYVNLKYYSDALPEGKYAFSIYLWNYVGLNPHYKMVPVAENSSVEQEITAMLQDAISVPFSGTVSKDMWKAQEARQVQMWLAEKEEYIAAAKLGSRYKLESLEANYRNRKRSLEQQILSTDVENILTMKESELENETARFEAKRDEVLKQSSMIDIYSTLIANGFIEIERA